MSELFPACFSCSNNFILSQSSSGSDDKKVVYETPEAKTIKPGDFSNFMSVLSLVDFLPTALRSKCISFAKSCNYFLSVKLTLSML